MINISPGAFDVLFGDIFTDNSADSKVILVPLRIWWIEFETHDRAHDHKIDSCSYVSDFAKCIVLTCAAVAVSRNGYHSKISYFVVLCFGYIWGWGIFKPKDSHQKKWQMSHLYLLSVYIFYLSTNEPFYNSVKYICCHFVLYKSAHKSKSLVWMNWSGNSFPLTIRLRIKSPCSRINLLKLIPVIVFRIIVLLFIPVLC